MKKWCTLALLFLTSLILLLSLVSSLETRNDCKGLVTYWSFDSGARDLIRNYNGQVNGAVLGRGIKNQAYYFDGVDDYIDFGNILNQELKDSFTIGLWIRLDNGALLKPQNYIFWKSDDRPGMRIAENKFVFTYFYYGNNSGKTSTRPVEENKWYYLTYTYNGSVFIGYINGEKEFSFTNSTSYVPGVTVLIGKDEKDSSYGRYFKGMIDELKVWDYALSESEIGIEYNFSTDPLSNASNICPNIVVNADCPKNADFNEDGKIDDYDEKSFIDCIYRGINCLGQYDLNEDGAFTAEKDAVCFLGSKWNSSFENKEIDTGIDYQKNKTVLGETPEGYFCESIGLRNLDLYCSSDKVWIKQGEIQAFCNNNFECKSNICTDEKCIKSNTMGKIVRWFGNLLKGK
jgi:hypothetical protein